MTVLFVALVAGVVGGLVTGGRPSNVGKRAIRGTLLLAAAIVLQLLTWFLDASPRTGLVFVLVSYGLLAAFAVRNIRLVGMPVVLIGLLLNFTVIAVNSGMPVRADAMYTVDRNPGALEHTAKRHIESEEDRLTVLGDVLPIKPFHEVVSFGDLILAFGLADVIFRLFQSAPPLYRRRDSDDEDVVDLRDPLDLRDRVLA